MRERRREIEVRAHRAAATTGRRRRRARRRSRWPATLAVTGAATETAPAARLGVIRSGPQVHGRHRPPATRSARCRWCGCSGSRCSRTRWPACRGPARRGGRRGPARPRARLSPARSPRSAVNDEKPPRCRATSTPSAHTVASWSTAPKCSSTRCPAHSAGTATSRAYQTASRKSVFPMPGRFRLRRERHRDLAGQRPVAQAALQAGVALVDLELPRPVERLPSWPHARRAGVLGSGDVVHGEPFTRRPSVTTLESARQRRAVNRGFLSGVCARMPS